MGGARKEELGRGATSRGGGENLARQEAVDGEAMVVQVQPPRTGPGWFAHEIVGGTGSSLLGLCGGWLGCGSVPWPEKKKLRPALETKDARDAMAAKPTSLDSNMDQGSIYSETNRALHPVPQPKVLVRHFDIGSSCLDFALRRPYLPSYSPAVPPHETSEPHCTAGPGAKGHGGATASVRPDKADAARREDHGGAHKPRSVPCPTTATPYRCPTATTQNTLDLTLLSLPAAAPLSTLLDSERDRMLHRLPLSSGRLGRGEGEARAPGDPEPGGGDGRQGRFSTGTSERALGHTSGEEDNGSSECGDLVETIVGAA